MIADEQLAEQEQRIVAAAGTGKVVDLSVDGAQVGDPADGATWAPGRTVRAELLIELLTAERTPETGRSRAIRLRGARIIGPLDLEGRALVCPLMLQECSIAEPVNLDEATAHTVGLPGCHVPALSATQLHTTSNLELGQGFTTQGEVRLLGAKIGGELSFREAILRNPDGQALSADGMTVEQGMYCDSGFIAEGEVRLLGAKIGGELSFDGAILGSADGPALYADRLTVEENMYCGSGFIAEGEVRLLRAKIGGLLSFREAILRNPDGQALRADGMTVEQGMYCDSGFIAEGEVQLLGAKIGGLLSFREAILRNPDGQALSADGMTVEQGMYCDSGFIAEGEVRLLGAKIGGELSFDGAILGSADGPALYADRLTVEENMYCDSGFTAEGRVRLLGAKIGGQLTFDGATLRNPNGRALDLEAAVVSELRLSMRAGDGTIDFTNARVGVFHDDQATWPARLFLRGFSYETLANDQVTVRDRLRWLKLHRGYSPGIYDQLAAAYRRDGHTEAARRVGVAKQWRRRSVYNPINWLLYLTIGYGYRTWLAGIWLTALAVLGSSVFARAQAHHLMKPGPDAPAFHAVAYAVDLLVPIVDLGQRKSWTLHGWALYWSWSFIAAGWVLTTAAVAGLTGIFKRD